MVFIYYFWPSESVPRVALIRNTTILFMLRFVRMGLSVFSLSLAATFFGISLERDAWLLAFNFIVVVETMVWGPVNETFRAKFVVMKGELGPQEALNKTRSLLLAITLVSIVLVVIILIFRVPISQLLAPGFSTEEVDVLAVILLALTPSLLFSQLNHIGIGVLNAYESYFVPEITGSFAVIVNIVSLVFLAPHIGIHSLLVGHYFGILLMSYLVVRQLVARHVPVFRGLGRVRVFDFLPFMRYALPFFIPYFFVQLNLLVEKSLGSQLGGGIVSVMDYSRKFIDIPLNVMTSVMLTILVPVLSACFVSKDWNGFVAKFKQVYQLGLLAVALLIAFFTTTSQELIATVLNYRGQLSSDTIALISDLSQYYAWASFAIFLYLIFGLALLSANKGWIYAGLGVVPQILMIVLNIVFYRSWGVYVFPVTLLAGHVISAIIMFFKFPGGFMTLRWTTIRYLAILVLLVVAVNLLIPRFGIRFEHDIFTLVFNVGVIGCIFLALLVAFKTEEWSYAVLSLKKIKQYVQKAK